MLEIKEEIQDKDDIESLLKKHLGNLERFVLTLVRNQEDAKDIIQETLISTYHNYHRIKNKQTFLSFLFTIAKRKQIDHFRKNKKYVATEQSSFDLLKIYQISEEDKTDLKILYDAIDKLPEKMKESILMFHIYGFSQKEIANVQSSSLPSVKIRLYRGKKRLQELLGIKTEEKK